MRSSPLRSPCARALRGPSAPRLRQTSSVRSAVARLKARGGGGDMLYHTRSRSRFHAPDRDVICVTPASRVFRHGSVIYSGGRDFMRHGSDHGFSVFSHDGRICDAPHACPQSGLRGPHPRGFRFPKAARDPPHMFISTMMPLRHVANRGASTRGETAVSPLRLSSTA